MRCFIYVGAMFCAATYSSVTMILLLFLRARQLAHEISLKVNEKTVEIGRHDCCSTHLPLHSFDNHIISSIFKKILIDY